MTPVKLRVNSEHVMDLIRVEGLVNTSMPQFTVILLIKIKIRKIKMFSKM